MRTLTALLLISGLCAIAQDADNKPFAVDLLDPRRPVEAQRASLAAAPDDPGDEARKRIRTMREESEDLDVVCACIAVLPGEPSPKAFSRIRARFVAVEGRDPREAQGLLAALASLDEEKSLPIFRGHMAKLDRYGRANAFAVLEGAPRPLLARALAAGLLDTTDPLGSLSPVPLPARVSRETRWCDWAASILAAAIPDLAFDREATLDERDRQIAAMRVRLK